MANNQYVKIAITLIFTEKDFYDKIILVKIH